MSREIKSLSGEVTDIFAHRFVVRTAVGRMLADLTPKGFEQIQLREGDRVEITGEMRPSELKVHSIASNGGPRFVIDHPPKPRHPDRHEQEPADPGPALKAAAAGGFGVIGEPRRKPKHFELLGRDPAGRLVEIHVELDGALRKTRPVRDDDPKWATELAATR